MKLLKEQWARLAFGKRNTSINESSNTKFGEWEFRTDDWEGVGNKGLWPTLKDYDGQHKYGVLYIGDLTIEVKPQDVYEDPNGGRDLEFYNIGYIIEADDSAPAGGGDAGSKKRYIGHDGKPYRPTRSYWDRVADDFQVFGSFDVALEAANKYIEAYMQEKGLQPGQGESDQMKKDREAHDRYFSY